MDDALVRQLVEFMKKKDHKCPFASKPPKNGRRIHLIPDKERGMWVLAAQLQKSGFEGGAALADLLARETIATHITARTAIMVFDRRPEYMYCSDWGVYRKEPKK